MAQKSKLEIQIETAQKRIQGEQRRLKLLEKQQAERNRKERNHRLCKRHGFIESLLPDTITLTDEQFETFVKQHIANKQGKEALANLATQSTGSPPNKPTSSERKSINEYLPAGARENNANAENTQDKTA